VHQRPRIFSKITIKDLYYITKNVLQVTTKQKIKFKAPDSITPKPSAYTTACGIPVQQQTFMLERKTTY